MIKNKKEKERISRINWVREQLEEEFRVKKEIDLNSFIILKSFKMGVSQRTFKEYLKTAIFLSGFKQKNNLIIKNE
jgi:hypothetical protein